MEPTAIQPGVAVVFGAYGGIGTALCRALKERGKQVIAVGRSRDRLDALSASLGTETLVADATDSSQVDAVFARVRAAHARIDGVANLAGAFLLKPAHLTTDEEFSHQVSINLTTAFNILRSSVKAMNETGGSIVLVSSVAARLGLANHERRRIESRRRRAHRRRCSDLRTASHQDQRRRAGPHTNPPHSASHLQRSIFQIVHRHAPARTDRRTGRRRLRDRVATRARYRLGDRPGPRR